ncbi:hypothetical protein M9H77_03617 [Catharanthus roseus]|uniref:Uncharacterized protein n=1 Tax=Catharanthus roseus TaxID=4058 RepID=A0ACC0CBX8_CATRO|nr:hypothetical protein M9H77_03617 [Catharanthus roseus]
MRSAYQLIFQAKNNPDGNGRSSTSSTSHFWTHLMYNNILLTWKNLSERITSTSLCCAICLGSGEDILQVFFYTEIWLNSDFSHLVNLFLSQVSYHAILEQMIGWPTYDSSWFAYFLCFLLSKYADRPKCSNRWSLVQGKRNFGAPPGKISSYWTYQTQYATAYSIAQDGCRWRPLDANQLKLNVDATWTTDGAIRLSFTVASTLSHSSEHEETLAIREGFRLAGRFDYTNYILESECKVVIDQLLARSGILGPLEHIHEQILSLIDRQSVIFFI